MTSGPPEPVVTAAAPVEVRAARYGLMGALAGALVGAAAAGFFAYLTAHDQIQSQAKQSQTDFLRNQRETIYTSLISDAESLETAESDCSADFTNHDSLPQLDACASRVSSSLPKVFSDQDAAEVIGTTTTGNIANRLGTDLGTGERGIAAAYARAVNSAPVAPPVLPAAQAQRIHDDRVEFIAAAHKELGVKG